MRAALSRVTDLERLAGKVGTGRVMPRDLLGLRKSLEQLPKIQEAGIQAKDPLIRESAVNKDRLDDVSTLLKSAISDDSPATLNEGGVIKKGWSKDLDQLREVRDGARDFLASLQVRERERTGIASLKVGFNKVFGYYLEVSHANLSSVPEDYIRRQTLINHERFITPELKDQEWHFQGVGQRVMSSVAIGDQTPLGRIPLMGFYWPRCWIASRMAPIPTKTLRSHLVVFTPHSIWSCRR